MKNKQKIQYWLESVSLNNWQQFKMTTSMSASINIGVSYKQELYLRGHAIVNDNENSGGKNAG